jgi:hypothetical protein
VSNKYNLRTGQVRLQKYAVDADTVIEKGDLLWLDTTDDVVKPASDFTWDTDLATTQGGFAAVFVGVAYEASADGDTADISVDVSADTVYEMDCASASFKVSDPVGPAKQTGNALEDQKVVAAAAAASVGRVQETVSASTKVKVSFASAYHTGSANVNAALG